MKCRKCKMVYTRIPEGFDLLGIYDKSYFQGGQQYGYGDYAASEKVLRKEFAKSVRIFKSLTKNQADLKLLELGSAYGYFLDEARDSFDCIGLEVSKDAAQYSIDRGNKVLTDYYDEATAERIGKIDVVAMFDVIEHLPDPLGTIQLIDKYLKKDGLILITTGNIDSLLAKLM
ncbi:MAG TPA: class I SAM-dependent methyltransferase, partial [Hanamia sp.]|nr:class I SAM-dependent methyltransferase [Hanamia sp.]